MKIKAAILCLAVAAVMVMPNFTSNNIAGHASATAAAIDYSESSKIRTVPATPRPHAARGAVGLTQGSAEAFVALALLAIIYTNEPSIQINAPKKQMAATKTDK